MSLSQQANILELQQHINRFSALSIAAEVFDNFVSLTVEMAVLVCATVDVAYVVAIAVVAICAL